jgi:hypothetical protein
MKKQYLKVVFKSYNQKQLMLLPPSLDEMIEPGHPVAETYTGLIQSSRAAKYL